MKGNLLKGRRGARVLIQPEILGCETGSEKESRWEGESHMRMRKIVGIGMEGVGKERELVLSSALVCSAMMVGLVRWLSFDIPQTGEEPPRILLPERSASCVVRRCQVLFAR